MRTSLILLTTALSSSSALLACSSGGTPSTSTPSVSSTTSAWECAPSDVPNGSAIACTATTASIVTTSYVCTSGDTAVPCPPPTVNAGAPTGCGNSVCGGCGVYDGGATGGDDAGGGSTSCDDGGAAGVPGSGTASGTGNGNGNGKGNGNGNGKGGGGNPHGSPPGPSGAGDDSGAAGSYQAGGGADDAGGPGWTCTGDGNYLTCNGPPSCAPGTHASTCGACIPDGTCDDCVPPASGGCWLTGGGFITDTGGTDSFGGNAMPMKAGTIRGEWEDVDHATGNKAHGEAQYLYCRHVNEPGPGQPSGPSHNFDINQVYFGGPARWFVGGTWSDGYWFDVMAEDHGEGKGAKAGGPDYYHFTIRQISAAGVSGPVIYDTEANLSGGNIQIHPPNNGHPYTPSSLPGWVSLQP